MALRVWLPLNGSLENKGISDVTVTNNGATVDNNGKIGKCYYFNGSQYITENSYNWSNFNTSSFSLCCWYKQPSPIASKNSQIIAIGTNSGWNNIRIGLLRRTSTGCPLLSVSDGTNNVNYACSSTIFPLDQWNHIAAIYDNGKMSIYINGSLNVTYNTTIVPVLNNSQHLGIGAASNGAEKLTGYLNDVRIYDHALSAKEVKEISQGLVLHYKLDGWCGGIGYNLFPVSAYDQSKVQSFPNSQNGVGYVLPQYTTNISIDAISSALNSNLFQVGEYYTLSFKARADGGTRIAATISPDLWINTVDGYQYNEIWVDTTEQTYILTGQYTGISEENATRLCDENQQFTLSEKSWVRYGANAGYWLYKELEAGTYTASNTFFAKDPASGLGKTCELCTRNADPASQTITLKLWRPRYTVNNYTVYIWDIKLEKGKIATPWIIEDNKITDSSGYGNNGVLIDNFAYEKNDISRYNNCLKLTNSYIKNIHFQYNIQKNPISISCWHKLIANEPTGAIYKPVFCIGNPTNGITFRGDHLEFGDGTRNYDYTINGIINNSTWTHSVFIYDGTNIKIYQNANLLHTESAPAAGLGLITQVLLNKFWAGISPTQLLADFRLYVTALSEEDIKELYQVPANIDNLNNIHTFELEEDLSSRELLALPWTNNFSTHDKTSLWTQYNSKGEWFANAKNQSSGSDYIKINPSGHTYYYDVEISIAANNHFYIGFERYDVNKTARSNHACTYIIDAKPSNNLNHQRYSGTVNLSTDTVNPTDTIALRILNGWDSTSSTNEATIHYLSLREVSGNPVTGIIKEQGQINTDEFIERENQASIYQNGIVGAKIFIEK